MFDISKESTEFWGTYIHVRSPKFKVYNKKHHAIAAIKYNAVLTDNGKYVICPTDKLYKVVNGKWTEVKFKNIYRKNENILE